MWRLARWTAMELASNEISFETRDGSRYVSMPANSSSFLTFAEDGSDSSFEKTMDRLIARGGTFVDVGANIGLVTVPAAKRVGPSGRVIAIEAHPRIFDFLCRNVSGNHLRNVDAVHSAVGDKTGSVAMVYNVADAGSTQVASDAASDGVRVPMDTLDNILASAGVSRIEYLKIDVEGYELPVLRGASATIARSPELVVQVEHWTTAANPYRRTLDDAAAFLVQAGLIPTRPDSSGELRRIQADRLSAEHGDVFWVRQ
jgi:FkbM family methyltransferase